MCNVKYFLIIFVISFILLLLYDMNGNLKFYYDEQNLCISYNYDFDIKKKIINAIKNLFNDYLESF